MFVDTTISRLWSAADDTGHGLRGRTLDVVGGRSDANVRVALPARVVGDGASVSQHARTPDVF